MRSLWLGLAAIAVVACGKGHSESLDDGGTVAPAPDAAVPEPNHPGPSTGPGPAGPNPATCTGASSYPTARCEEIATGSAPLPGCAISGGTCGSSSACPIDEA